MFFWVLIDMFFPPAQLLCIPKLIERTYSDPHHKISRRPEAREEEDWDFRGSQTSTAHSTEIMELWTSLPLLLPLYLQPHSSRPQPLSPLSSIPVENFPYALYLSDDFLFFFQYKHIFVISILSPYACVTGVTVVTLDDLQLFHSPTIE